MNSRIRELAKQARKALAVDAMDGGEFNMKAYEEKFAELIVRECLTIVERKEYSYHEADPLWETAQLIKEHFGVDQCISHKN